jgi:hypothetical protein
LNTLPDPVAIPFFVSYSKQFLHMVGICFERLVWQPPLEMEEDALAGTKIGEEEGFSRTIQS